MKALLVIVDGLGCAPDERGNAITPDTMPRLFGWMREHGHAVLEASGRPVGLGAGQTGNSEAGHLVIGAGRRVPSLLEAIGEAYEDGTYQAHPLWQELGRASVLHVVGLLSDAGVHGFWPNLVRAATLAGRHGIPRIHVHALLDGVDSQEGSAPRLLGELEAALEGLPGVALATVMGRRWACDRTGDLETTRVLRDHLCGAFEVPSFAMQALSDHLAGGQGEKDFPCHAVVEDPFVGAGEPVLLVNHRADRTRQVAEVFAQTHPVYSLVELEDRVPLSRVFFPKQSLTDGVGFVLRSCGIRTARVAEQCKFPHVTYFFNGFNDSLGEEAVCVPSIPESEIPTHPEMSAREVTAAVRAILERGDERAVVANLANTDQVGHTGQVEAARRAATCVDDCLAELYAVCQTQGYTLIVTSDHGNADVMLDGEGRPLGSHSPSPVPLVVVPAEPGTLPLLAGEGIAGQRGRHLPHRPGDRAPGLDGRLAGSGRPCMKRLHVSVTVEDLEASLRFYERLFGVPPDVRKPDYAKWMLDDPCVNFAIDTQGEKPGVDHLGIQVSEEGELGEIADRLAGAEAVARQDDAECCYARSDKAWVWDPAGRAVGDLPDARRVHRLRRGRSGRSPVRRRRVLRLGRVGVDGDALLFTPGPLTTSESVKRAMLRDLGSRDDAFIRCVAGVRSGLLQVAGVSQEAGWEAIPVQGCGTYGLEAAISSLVPASGGMLVASNGAYAERLAKLARVHGIVTEQLDFDEDTPLDPERVGAALDARPELTHLAFVHCETSTGLLNPVAPIAAAARARGRTVILDSMSAFGGVPLSLRDAGVDFLISSSNKCIQGVPGFSFVLARREALLATEGSARTVSFDLLAQWRGLEKDGQFRFTPPTHAFLAFEQALHELAEEGRGGGPSRSLLPEPRDPARGNARAGTLGGAGARPAEPHHHVIPRSGRSRLRLRCPLRPPQGGGAARLSGQGFEGGELPHRHHRPPLPRRHAAPGGCHGAGLPGAGRGPEGGCPMIRLTSQPGPEAVGDLAGRLAGARQRAVCARRGAHVDEAELSVPLRQRGLEAGLVVDPQDARVATGPGDLGDVRGVGDGDLCTGRVVDAVVEQHVDEIPRALVSERGQRPHAHQRGAVAVEDHHALVGQAAGNAEPQARGAAHGSHHVELAIEVGLGVERASGESGGGDHRSVVSRRPLDGRHRAIRVEPPWARPCGQRLEMRGRCGQRRLCVGPSAHRPLGRDEGIATAGAGHVIERPLERGKDGVLRLGHALPGDLHQLEQLRGDGSHHPVLRLVRGAARLAAPGGDHQDRDLEASVQGGQRVDRVAEARVLEHRHAAYTGELRTRGDRHRVALVGGADVARMGIRDGCVDERRQIGAGHARHHAEARLTQPLEQYLGTNHGSTSTPGPACTGRAGAYVGSRAIDSVAAARGRTPQC